MPFDEKVKIFLVQVLQKCFFTINFVLTANLQTPDARWVAIRCGGRIARKAPKGALAF